MTGAKPELVRADQLVAAIGPAAAVRVAEWLASLPAHTRLFADEALLRSVNDPPVSGCDVLINGRPCERLDRHGPDDVHTRRF